MAATSWRLMPAHRRRSSSGAASRMAVHRAEVVQQRELLDPADARDEVQFAGGGALVAQQPVVGDGEAVGLVAHALQQLQGLAACAAEVTGRRSRGTMVSSRLARPISSVSCEAVARQHRRAPRPS